MFLDDFFDFMIPFFNIMNSLLTNLKISVAGLKMLNTKIINIYLNCGKI